MSTHMVFICVHILMAIISSFPTGTASKDCLLGYNALCSFTPISTVILLALASLHIYLELRNRKAARENPQTLTVQEES